MWAADDISANGVRTRYYRTGGGGPPVVLAHGITDNGLCWTALAEELQQDHDIVMYDARGHGESEDLAEGYSFEAMATDLVGLITALGLEEPAVIGHSMGAATAAKAAAGRPDLVRCVILEDPPWREEVFGLTEEQRVARATEWKAGILQRRSLTRDELVRMCREENPGWPEADYVPWAESKLQVSTEVFGVLTAPYPRWQDTVSAITCPILLLTGDPGRGAIVTPKIAEEASGLWRNGRVAHVEGAGHCIRRMQPGSYLEAVRKFLSEDHRGPEKATD